MKLNYLFLFLVAIIFLGCPPVETKLATPSVSFVSGDGEVTLSWDNVPNAKSYELVWNNGSSESVVSPVKKIGLTNGTVYAYKLKAVGQTVGKAIYIDSDYAEGTAGPNVPVKKFIVEFSVDGGNGIVSAVADGASILTGVPVKKDTIITFTATPNSGYEVDFWTNAIEDSADNKKATLKVTDNIAVKVKFKLLGTPGGISFPITFSVTGGNGAVVAKVDGVNIASGDSVDKNKTIDFVATANIGYEVDSWTVATPNSVDNTKASFIVLGPANITVSFKAEIYTVKFIANGGIPAPADQLVEYGKKAVAPATLTKAGYIFDGWFTEDTFTNLWDFAINTVADNTTLYAKWSLIPPSSEKKLISMIETTTNTVGGIDAVTKSVVFKLPASANLSRLVFSSEISEKAELWQKGYTQGGMTIADKLLRKNMFKLDDFYEQPITTIFIKAEDNSKQDYSVSCFSPNFAIRFSSINGIFVNYWHYTEEGVDMKVVFPIGKAPKCDIYSYVENVAQKKVVSFMVDNKLIANNSAIEPNNKLDLSSPKIAVVNFDDTTSWTFKIVAEIRAIKELGSIQIVGNSMPEDYSLYPNFNPFKTNYVALGSVEKATFLVRHLDVGLSGWKYQINTEPEQTVAGMSVNNISIPEGDSIIKFRSNEVGAVVYSVAVTRK